MSQLKMMLSLFIKVGKLKKNVLLLTNCLVFLKKTKLTC